MNEISTLTVHYRLSDKWCNEQLVSNGRKPQVDQCIQYNLLDAAAEHRKSIADCPFVREKMNSMVIDLAINNSPKFDGTPTLAMVAAECDRLTQADKARKRKELDSCVSNAICRVQGAIERQALTLDPPLTDFERDQARQHNISLVDYDTLLAEYQQCLPGYQQNAKERERQEAEAKQQKQAAMDAAEAEKCAWVKAHGSDRLRRAFERGYSCQRQYVIERAAFDAPGFTVDYDDKAGWDVRACPSTKALNVEDEVQHLGEVVTVRLTRGTGKGGAYNCEAVVIRKYLGWYDLVKVI